MKKFLLSLALMAAPFSAAQAAFNFDGCFQLVTRGAMYPAFCLSGTNEEGINGAGVRLVIFGTNTDRVIACGLSSSLGGSEDSLEYIQNDVKELVLSEVKESGGRLQGKATLGRTVLDFFQINQDDSSRLMQKFYDDKRCEGLAIGELRNLRNTPR